MSLVPSVRTYASDKVVVIIGGSIMTGYADGDFLEIEQVSDGTTSQAGADGEIARSRSADKRHRVTMTLQQTSISNDVLSGLYEADQITGLGVVPVLVEDLTGTTKFAAAQGWIVKRPNAGFGKDSGTRAWVIETGAAVYNLGGNS